MFCDRICLVHNFPCTAINLKACQEENAGFLCSKCLTDLNESDEVAHLSDIQLTIDDIVEQQKNKEKQFNSHLSTQLEELNDQLDQFQQSLNKIIKQITTLSQKLNNFEKNEAFYLEFIKKYYKGQCLLSYPNRLDQKNTNVMQFINEGIEIIIKSDFQKKIYEQLKSMMNEYNYEEIITKKITQKKKSKKKAITLSQNCPIHEQEVYMIVLDQNCQRNRLICMECFRQYKKEGLDYQFTTINEVNQRWQEHYEKLSNSLSEMVDKSQKNIDTAQLILKKQNIKQNDSKEYIQLKFEQSFSELKKKQKKVDYEKYIRFEELKSEELMNRITNLVEGSLDTEFQQIQNLQKQEQRELINGVKEHFLLLQQYKHEYEQQIQSKFGIYKIEVQKPMNKYNNLFNDTQQCQEYLRKIQDQYQSIINLTLEDCNNFLVYNDESIKQKVSNWSQDLQNIENFKQFAIILVDQIKRQKLSNFTSQIRNINENLQFNPKQLFYLMYINSSKELQYELLRSQINKQSIPFLYLNPNLIEKKAIQDLFILNLNLYYLFPECYPIINLSFSQTQSSYGKTQLINQIFYKSEVFEVNDYCDSNLHTIDIMFDFCFNGTRNLAIADVHGLIPFEILIKILPLFKLWIVQMDTEEELQENFEQFISIKQQLQKLNSECCFVIRNSKTKDQNKLNQLEIEMKDQAILLYKIIDLTQKGLDKQKINSVIESFSQFLFGIIQTQRQNLSNSQDFLTNIQNYYDNNDLEIQQIQRDNQLLEALMKELKLFINDPLGFYSQNAFPIRSIIWQKKNNKQQQYQFDRKTMDQQTQQVKSIGEEIYRYEEHIPNTKATLILDLFQQIFDSKDYYNLYLKLIEQLRQFNKKNAYELQEENKKIIEEQQLKKQRLNENQDSTNNKDSIKKLEKQFDQNLKTGELRNIEIELFWRELIQIKQEGCSLQLKINPAEIIANLVKKGEPFEFLDGDQLKIVDTKLLEDLINQFSDPNEKVLIVSIIGPQSSGKSTIFNNIFGCHFRMSENKSTKRIQLKLLKITQKSSFDNKFDYILVLDAEGLYNPNSIDPEFDKKVTLFILNISDIIFINVKGDIPTQFKNLIEMCIFYSGQMKNGRQSVKQFSWCFNQNDDNSHFILFQQQIQSIINKLNFQVNKTEETNENKFQLSFDFNQILDQKGENIKIFGFASTEQTWSVNANKGIFEELRQQIINELYSEDVYQFGVQMIKLHLKKIGDDQNFEPQSLNSFIQNTESIWQSICRLPDLLEFTELLEYKQDKFIKAKYEQIYQNQSFVYGNQIQNKIQNQVLKQKKLNFEFFEKIQKVEKKVINKEIKKIQSNVQQELQLFKQDNQIEDKIYQKFIKKLDESLQSYELTWKFILIDEIKKYQREYQQKWGLIQIENFVTNISENTEKLTLLLGKRDLIEMQFNDIWNNILRDAKKQQETDYNIFSEAQYNLIQSLFVQYQYEPKTQNLKDFFFNLSKNPPKIDSDEEYKINAKNQFQIVLNQNGKYQDIFYMPIQDRLQQSSKNYLVNLNDFFDVKAVVYQIQFDKLYDYLHGDAFYKDFCQFLINQKKQNQKYYENNREKCNNDCIQSFFSIFFHLNILFKIENYDEFRLFIIESDKWYKFNQDPQPLFQVLQSTLSFSEQTFQIVKNIEFTKNIKEMYQSLKFEEINFNGNSSEALDQQYNKKDGNLKFLFSEKILPRNQTSVIFEFIQDQNQNQKLLDLFCESSTLVFNQIISQQDGWNKIYFQIYDIIKYKMSSVKLQNSNKTWAMNQLENDLEIEETLAFNNILIKQIISIIEEIILEYNKQFANFGLIFSVNGERCIYYFSIFIIWSFLCQNKWNQLQENYKQLIQMKDEQLKKFIVDIELNQKKYSILNALALSKNIKQVEID